MVRKMALSGTDGRMLADVIDDIPHAAKSFNFIAIEIDAKSFFGVEQKLDGIERIESQFFEFGGCGNRGSIDILNFRRNESDDFRFEFCCVHV